MVQRKQARKKPKDLVVLADEGLPGPGQVMRRAGDPGARDVRTALAPLPNYMRATTCSGAKVGGLSRKESVPAPPPPTTKREQVVFARAAAPHVGRATCSSTMKGAAGHHVCSYAYCSLKGHARASVEPLNAFLASRRRLIKTQQSMKLKGASPFRKPNNNAGEGYFVEIHNAAAAALPVTSLPIPTEEMAEYVTFRGRLRCGGDDDDAEDKLKDSADDSCGSSVVISDGSLELLGSTKNRGRKDTENLVVDHEDDYFGACKSDISDELGVEHEANIPQDVGGDAPKEYSSDGISSALSGISFEDVTSECADAATSQRKKLHISGRRRTSTEEGSKQMRPFKPKAPNFLPVETGPEAEKVDLRHQAANDPRDAEEWMVDYALRKAVKKLARAQKRKVEMLVQAFETVLPAATSEKKPLQHDDDKNTFTLSRPSQACG
ncbi:hypothetical protein PR202_gb03756 [Eleusine coracana subsp. coracana]|uniref:Calmodulin-binding domain-containing protein n=1 Tax=Eleusine coracana subsp. coracana TaxID=191504 RepID=A0AAV5E3N6_ELECO|nr:hypothetical protein QOZ80_1BG0096480 [Eleusine coracana subsp. coracana]GJN16735.1 hypothetical protein PR202_gb03756 [Eleusine coracana subsp. coracana]